MANAAEKKRIARAKSLRSGHYKAWAIINVIYFLLRIVWFWSSFGVWHFVGLLVITGISFVTLSVLLNIADEGNDFSIYQDLLYVNWGVQLASSFTDWGFLLYLSIPGFIMYQYGGFIMGMLRGGMFGGGGSGGAVEGGDDVPPSAKELKRQKRAERRRTKVIRR